MRMTGKRFAALMLALAAALMACARRHETAPAPEEGRILIAYFSNTGNTENIAGHLAEILGLTPGRSRRKQHTAPPI